MPVNGTQLVTHYANQANTLSTLIEGHKQLIGELQQQDVTLATELVEAKRQLAAVYLPALTDAAFERAAKLTGFQGFQRRDPRLAMAQEKKVLEANLANIESDEHYQHRDTLVGQAGTLQQELDSAKETFAPLQAECEKFELLQDFQELVDVGYDTPQFKEKWWNASYWRHWSAGDRICKALDMKDFGDDVLPAYRKYQEPRDVMRADIQRLTAEIDATHKAVEEHDKLAARYKNLEAIYLQESQDFLGEHLEHADFALLETWVANEADILRPAQMGLRRLAGILAKRKFTGEMAQQGVPQIIGQLQERQQQAQQKVAKFSRPKYAYQTFPDPDDFSEKAAAIEAQRYKMQQRQYALMQADDYYRYDLRQDQSMWWLYLLGSPPPRYYPGLYDYYGRHPGITVLVDDRDYVDLGTGRAARAFADRDLERGGGAYLS